MRVLVCGGRDFRGRTAVFAALNDAHAEATVTALAHGACRARWRGKDLDVDLMTGADRWADEWALEHNLVPDRFPVKHELDGPWPAAGPRRNARMLTAFKPSIVVGFPGGRGTADMIARAKQAGVAVIEIAEVK